jgi:biopolymer transport protein ExbB
MSSIQLLISHGFAGWLIVGSGVILIVVGLERLVTLFGTLSFVSASTLEKIQELILARKYNQVFQVCNQQPNNPELVVIRDGLMAVENGREAMVAAVDGVVLRYMQASEKRLPYLSLIASSSTLMGLLGTISGLIRTFASIAEADPSVKARILGEGISEAMYATEGGLVVGLAAMVIYTICKSKADDIVARTQKAGLNLITWVEQSERTAGNAKPI